MLTTQASQKATEEPRNTRNTRKGWVGKTWRLGKKLKTESGKLKLRLDREG